MPPVLQDSQRGPRFVDVPAPDPLRGTHDQRARLVACLRTLLPRLTVQTITSVCSATRILALGTGSSFRTPAQDQVTAAVVLQGRLLVTTPEGQVEVGPGGALHMRALLAPRDWPVRVVDQVRALRPTRLALLPRQLLAALARRTPAVAEDLIRCCDEEVSTGVRPAASDALECTSIAVLALPGAPDVDTVTEALRDELAAWGSVASGDLSRSHVRAPRVRSAWTHYVEQQELTRRYVVTAVRRDADVDAALAEADRVVLLSGPDPSALDASDRARLWQTLGRPAGSVHLAVLHPAGSAPDERAVVWARHPLVDLVHNLRGERGDYARLARVLAGRASAVVLTGRESRAWAGLGVLQEFERRGRVPDLICGVGDGAVIARLYARHRCLPTTLRALKGKPGWIQELLGGPSQAQLRARLGGDVSAEFGTGGDLTGWQPCITLDAPPAGIQGPESLPSLIEQLNVWCPPERVWLVKAREGVRRQRSLGECERTGHRTLDIRLSVDALRDVRAIAAAARTARGQADKTLTQEMPARGVFTIAGWRRRKDDA